MVFVTRWRGTFPWGRGCHECRGLAHSGATHTTSAGRMPSPRPGSRWGRGCGAGAGPGLGRKSAGGRWPRAWPGEEVGGWQVAQARRAHARRMVSELQPGAGGSDLSAAQSSADRETSGALGWSRLPRDMWGSARLRGTRNHGQASAPRQLGACRGREPLRLGAWPPCAPGRRSADGRSRSWSSRNPGKQERERRAAEVPRGCRMRALGSWAC